MKVGKNQKTVLSSEELDDIVKTFINHEVKEDFTVSVSYEQIKEKNYSLSAGQYFDIKIKYIELSQEEFNSKMKAHAENLNNSFKVGKSLEEEIKNILRNIKYEG